MQPVGPLLLVGCSMAGCTIAAAMAAVLGAAGRKLLLVQLDGCAGSPRGTALHEPTWCDSYTLHPFRYIMLQ